MSLTWGALYAGEWVNFGKCAIFDPIFWLASGSVLGDGSEFTQFSGWRVGQFRVMGRNLPNYPAGEWVNFGSWARFDPLFLLASGSVSGVGPDLTQYSGWRVGQFRELGKI